MKNNQYTATPNWFDKIQQTDDSVSTGNTYVTNFGNIQQQSGLTDLVIEITGEEDGNGLSPEVSWNKEESKLSFVKTKFLKEGDPVVDADYVTTIADNPQDVLSNKDFINGLSINKHRFFEKDGILYLDGNLALTGGLVIYADNPEGGGDPGPGFGGGTILDISITGEGNVLSDVSLSEDKTILQFVKTNLDFSGNYVDFTSDQDISGVKNFTNGIKLNGNRLYNDNGVIYLEGDLAVTGGITTFATAGRKVSTIMDGVVADEVTITVAEKDGIKQLQLKEGVGGGLTSAIITGTGNAVTDASLEDEGKTLNLKKDKTFLILNDLLGYAKEDWVNTNFPTKTGIGASGTWGIGISGNAASATKLQTSRTLWGQSFDGTKNISGILDGCTGFAANWTDVWDDGTNKHPWYGYDHTHINTGIYSTTITDYFGMCLKTRDESSIVLLTGKVGIGTTTPNRKLDVAGSTGTIDLYINGIRLYKSEDGTLKLDGNLLVTGGITQYSTTESGGGSGGGGGIDEDALWAILGGTGTQQINKSHLTTALTGYATESWVTGKNYAVKATTLAGYGITDAYTKTEADNKYLLKTSYTAADILAKLKTVDGSGSGLDADLLDGKHNGELNGFLNTKALPYTSNDKTNWWCKIATIKITVQHTSKEALLLITDAYTTTTNSVYGFIYIKVEQQASFGNMPNVTLRVFGSIPKSNIEGRLTLTSTSSTLDVYFKEIFSYQRGYLSFVQGSEDIRSVGGLIQTLPTATHNILCENDFRAGRLENPRTLWGRSFDGTANVNGDLAAVGKIIFSNTSAFIIDEFGNFRAKSTVLDENSWNVFVKNNTSAICVRASNGNVGIGTTSPSVKLDVAGTIKASNNVEAANAVSTNIVCANKFQINNNTAGIYGTMGDSDFFSIKGYGSANVGTLYIETGDDGNEPIVCRQFGQGGTVAHSITLMNSSGNQVFNNVDCSKNLYVTGNVGIGTTSPTEKLHVNGNIRATSSITATVHMYVDTGWFQNNKSGTGLYNSANDMRFYAIANGWYSDVGMTIEGNFLSKGGITQYSDQRAKTIIEQITLSLKDIAQSPAIRFKWNGWKQQDDGKTHIGGIAQYIQNILPEVIYNTDDVLTMDYATTGYVFAVNTAKHLLDYETKTDKEINKLKKRIKYLEKQLKKLGYEEANIMDN